MAATAKSERRTLAAKDIKTMSPVDEDGAYRLIIQIGANNRWRKFGGGKWKRDEKNDVSTPRGVKEHAWIHEAALHETGPIPGSIANGLIELHNRWVGLNKDKQPGGQVDRQLVVIDIKQTEELPPEMERYLGGGMSVVAMKMMFREVMNEIHRDKK